jgi:hypothetical protein
MTCSGGLYARSQNGNKFNFQVQYTATPVCRSISPACAKPLRRRQGAQAQGPTLHLFFQRAKLLPLEGVVCCLGPILDGGYIMVDEFDDCLKEAEILRTQLITFGKKIRKDETRL